MRRTSLVGGGATLAAPGVTQVGAPAPAVDVFSGGWYRNLRHAS